MISLKNIWTISIYESKVLWRNWFFRIIAIAGVLFVTLFNVLVFSQADTPRWEALSNSWMMPLSTMVIISIPQVAAVIFLATGLIKKDKKVDTNEVFFVRPITNLDYVFGKALALFKLFFALNMVLVGISAIVNVTSSVTVFNPVAFILFPLLVSLPSIVFTTGISFLLVTLLRNQPISIVLLLGVSAVELIYYFDQFSNILDFMAFRLSLYPSEIAGFVGADFTFVQRGFYLLTGIALLFATSFFLDRLASHKRVKIATGVLSIVLLAGCAFIMTHLWQMRQGPISERKAMVSMNNQWAKVPNVTILSNDLEIEMAMGSLSASANMVVKNNTAQPIDSMYFTLNPSLDVDELIVDNQQVNYREQLQVVSVTQGIRLAPGEQKKITIRYHGTINEAVAHLDVNQKRYEEAYDYFMYSLFKKYAFLQSDYALLTKDVMWYPDTHINYSTDAPAQERLSFIDFSLKVRTPDGLRAISQGKMEEQEGSYQFRPEFPLPQLSLIIGQYEKKEISVDSVSYAVYHYPQHDYFSEQLEHLGDTINYLIKDLANEYEDAQKLHYPFGRLQFVEVPYHYTAYDKVYESHQAYLQPEMVFYPEKGGDIHEFDFRRQMEDMNRQARQKNQTLSDKQKEANIFNNLIKKIYTRQIGNDWVVEGRNQDEPDYALFPNYYSYNAGIVSEEWTLLNRSIATYLQNDQKARTDFSRNLNGISFTEECNELMRKSTLSEILTTAEFNQIVKSISLKSQYLFSYLGQLVGDEVFKAFLFEWVNTHQHQLTDYQDFRTAVEQRFSLDIQPIIQKVYSDTTQAAFEVLNVQKYEVLDGERKRYQILMAIVNSGENDGVIEVKFNMNEKRDEFRRSEINEAVEQEEAGKLTVIEKGQIKQLGFLLDEKPHEISLNTIISRNIPSVINIPVGTIKKNESITLFEGERSITDVPKSAQYEVIVDNEDEGFSTFSPIEPTYLRAYLDSRKEEEQKYYGNWFRSYSKWLATTGSDFYGSVVRSAHFTRSGSGEKTTTWTPDLKEEGFYDIYVYMKGKNQNEFMGRDGENRQFNYHYIIKHGDGTDNIQYNISNAEPGWNFLGSYYFNTSGGSISLTDECDLRTVYADAIKWVKQ